MNIMASFDKSAVRSELPATRSGVYLNTGTFGPLPRSANAAIVDSARDELETGRIVGGMQGYVDYYEGLGSLRGELARVLGTDDSQITLTNSTTEGINIGLFGRMWSPGDRVLTTTQEHHGVLFPLALLADRFGVEVSLVEVGDGSADRALAAFEEALQGGARMVVLSHVLYTTGATLPLSEITQAAHRVGAVVHVDGAQSVGAIPVDVVELGVDSYAFPGQKWLLGPEGSGGLYLASRQFDELSTLGVGPSTVDYFAYDHSRPLAISLSPRADRFETSTRYRPAVAGFTESLRFVEASVGRDAALAEIARLSSYCRAAVTSIPEVRVRTPEGQGSGLIALEIGDADLDGAVAHLANDGITVRAVHEAGVLRISTGFYNTEEEIDRAVASLRNFLA